MKKLFYIVTFTLYAHATPFPTLQQRQLLPQQLQQTMPQLIQQPQQQEITDKTLNLFNDTEFQKEFKNVVKNFGLFKNLIENFNKSLISFSKQPLEFQKNYNNFEQLIIPLENIRQKPLTIAITKLLQYKTAAHKANLASANKLINDLEKILDDVDQTLKNLTEKPEWASSFFNPSPKISAKHSIAEVFKDTIKHKYPFKIKKIRRAITNWNKV